MARFVSFPVSVLSCNVIREEQSGLFTDSTQTDSKYQSVNKGGTFFCYWLLSFRVWHDASSKLASSCKDFILFYFQGHKRNGIIILSTKGINIKWLIYEQFQKGKNFSMPLTLTLKKSIMPTLSNGSEVEVFLTFSRPRVTLLFILNMVFSSAQYLLMGLISTVA